MIYADTSAWFAMFASDDQHHAEAIRWQKANRERLVTTDYVVDETLTLLRTRRQSPAALTFGTLAFGGRLAEVVYLSEADVLAAWEVFRNFDDKEWSFTDCTSKVVMERLGITTAFAFDRHFAQFGVDVAP